MKDIKNSVVWIGDTGFDNGGSATLGVYFRKNLGIKVFFKGIKESEGIEAYSTYEELQLKLDKIQPKIILIMPDFITTSGPKKLISFFDFIKDIKSKYNSKVILIDCTRRGVIYKKDTPEILEQMKNIIGSSVDSIWSINGISKQKWNFISNYRTIDLNLYTLEKDTLTNRENTIGYVSRFSLFKGIGRLFTQGENFILKQNNLKYPLIHLGNDHIPKVLKERGVISGLLGIHKFFCHTIKDKRPRESFSMKSDITEPILENKYNVYPRYNLEDRKSVFKKVGIGICPTLSRVGTKRDGLYLKQNSKFWGEAMEYVNYEMIDYGIPVLFSKDYCEVYDKGMLEAFPDLIYTTLDEALEKSQHYYSEFQKFAPVQKKWLQNKLIKVQKNIEKALLEELEKE